MSIDAAPMAFDIAGSDEIDGGHDTLCTNCQAIDFDRIFSMRNIRSQQVKGYGIFLHDLSYPADSSCRLCSIFTDFKQGGHKRLPKIPKWRLVGRSAQKRFSDHLPDSTLLSVEPSAANENNPTNFLLFVTGDGQMSGRSLCDTVNWSIVREWLQFCRDHHSKSCNSEFGFMAPGFKLIDCETRTIVECVETCLDYVTLSYVWGKGELPCMHTQTIGAGLPRTIDDAIEAVKQLGLRYLWIDRYCIDQTDIEQQAQLIKCMGQIYSKSVITIIAAAGDGPDHGLPGVNATPRMPQLRVRTRHHVLTKYSTIDDELIRASRWNSRGWTFQEALLSKRKLVFTDHYVVYQCSTMHCAENLSVPLQALHTKNMQGFRAGIYFCRPFPTHGVGDRPEDMFYRISDYCHRDFTFDYDVPRAFEGICEVFASMKVPVLHYHGVPLLGPNSMAKERGIFKIRFIHGISWTIRHLGSTKRRNLFPSWSWMDWKVETNARVWHPDYPQSRDVGPLSYDAIDLLAVESTNGKIISCETLQRELDEKGTSSRPPTHLHLYGLIFELELIRRGESYYDKLDDQDFHNAGIEEWDVFVVGTKPDILTVSCLILGHRPNRANLMVMLKSDSTTYERIGCHVLACPKSRSVLGLIEDRPEVNLRTAHVRLG